MRSRWWTLIALGALAVPLGAHEQPAQAAALRAEQKVQAILARSVAAPPAAAPALKTSFTEEEVNAYFRSSPDLPIGLKQPTVTLLDDGRIDTRALVDLDLVRESQKRGWLDPLAYVSGVLEVQAIGILKGTNGQGVYTFESARVGGAPVPKTVLQELLAYYTRTPETPKGITLDTPFDLPAAIRALEVRRGTATVIQ